MTRRLLLLATPLLLSTALVASAAPHKATLARHPKLAVALPMPPPTPQATGGFPDVPPGHWAAQAVETLRRAGIVQGYPSGTYRTGQ